MGTGNRFSENENDKVKIQSLILKNHVTHLQVISYINTDQSAEMIQII